MLNLPRSDQDTELHLTDTTFEDAGTLRLFLELVSPARFSLAKLIELDWKPLSLQLNRLITFLDKYGSEVGVRMLRLLSSELILRQTEITSSCEGQLIFACMTNDLGLCVKLIGKSSDLVWGPKKKQPPASSVGPDGLLDAVFPAHFCEMNRAPFKFVASLPLPYQWALGRSAIIFSPREETDKFCDKFVEIVCKILTEDDGTSIAELLEAAVFMWWSPVHR